MVNHYQNHYAVSFVINVKENKQNEMKNHSHPIVKSIM